MHKNKKFKIMKTKERINSKAEQLLTSMTKELTECPFSKAKYGWVLITPEKATLLLSFNTHNRPPKKRKIKQLIHDMNQDDYEPECCNTVLVTENREIGDGQNILFAIIQSRLAQWLMVGIDTTEKVFIKNGRGAPKTAMDVFGWEGIKYASELSTGIRKYLHLKAGVIGTTSHNTVIFSIEDLLKEYNSKPEYWDDLAVKCSRWYQLGGKLISPSKMIAHNAYISNQNTYDGVDEFFEKLATGAGTKLKDPELVARKKLVRCIQQNRRLSNLQLDTLIVAAWNKRAKGETVNNIRENQDYKPPIHPEKVL